MNPVTLGPEDLVLCTGSDDLAGLAASEMAARTADATLAAQDA